MANVYEMVTARIIEQMDKGIIPWHKPWHIAGKTEEMAINYVSRKPYSTLNQWLLMEPGEYLTFTQIKALKGTIKKVDTARAFRNSVAYLQSWAANLKRDPKAIVTAAGKAERAARFILGERETEKA